MTWYYNKDGIYTVKSTRTQPAAADLGYLIWKIETAPKLRHFLWRVHNEGLPVAACLKSRTIIASDLCSRCESTPETVNHALLSCRFAKEYWTLAPLPHQFVPGEDLRQNLLNVLHQPPIPSRPQANPSTPTVSLFPWLCWSLWKARNSWCFNHQNLPPSFIISQALSAARTWLAAQEPAKTQSPQLDPVVKQWLAPPQGHIKCNVAGFCVRSANKAGLGWILRNSAGIMMGYGIQSTAGIASSLEVKAHALGFAMCYLLHLGYKSAIFEMDKQIFLRVTSPYTQAFLYTIIEDIYRLALEFSSVSFKVVRSSCNQAADQLAKRGLSSYLTVLETEIVPDWLRSSLDPSVQINS